VAAAVALVGGTTNVTTDTVAALVGATVGAGVVALVGGTANVTTDTVAMLVTAAVGAGVEALVGGTAKVTTDTVAALVTAAVGAGVVALVGGTTKVTTDTDEVGGCVVAATAFVGGAAVVATDTVEVAACVAAFGAFVDGGANVTNNEFVVGAAVWLGAALAAVVAAAVPLGALVDGTDVLVGGTDVGVLVGVGLAHAARTTANTGTTSHFITRGVQCISLLPPEGGVSQENSQHSIRIVHAPPDLSQSGVVRGMHWAAMVLL
jgi:hypothetical protein